MTLDLKILVLNCLLTPQTKKYWALKSPHVESLEQVHTVSKVEVCKENEKKGLVKSNIVGKAEYFDSQ